MKEKMLVTILEDGTVRLETGEMGTGAAHVQADALVKSFCEAMGGEVKVVKKQRHTHVKHGQRQGQG